MARPPKLTDEQLAYAAETLARGRATKAALAKELGISAPGLAGAVERWQAERALKETKETKVTPSAPASPPPAAASEGADVDRMSPDEQRDFYSRVMRQAEKDYYALAAEGETAEARKVLDIGIKASTALQRLDKNVDKDALVLSKEELEARKQKVRQTLENYLSTGRPLTCAHCGHELSVAWGRGES